jgi:anti-sigma factor RsiW
LSFANEMTCRELVELVTDYLEGVLAPAERARFDEHLEACPYCVTYVEQMRTTVATLGRVTRAQLSPEAQKELLAAFRDWKRPG